jgi:hypothetical protein
MAIINTRENAEKLEEQLGRLNEWMEAVYEQLSTMKEHQASIAKSLYKIAENGR